MPLTNETGTLSMMFSGEDFSAPGTVAELRRAGHAIDNNPASYLIHQAEEDSSFPASVNGRFHGLLLDRKTQSAVLFNDRYGMHRIYYHQSAEAFYFAAEAKAILAVCPQLREVDLEGLGELVSLGCVLENRSVFKGIQVLPPASAWTFRDRRLIRRLEYFAPMEWEDQPPLDAEAFYQSIREVFSQRVGWYFGGREKVGVSLTGGLDSRMIMAWRREANRDFSCYSFGGMFRDCQDVSIAREVATRSGRQHQVIPVASEFLSQFPKYAERAVYLTDGCVNVSHSPDLYVNEIAATIAPVRLTGNYGGEVLRRVRAFKPMNTAPGLFTEDFLKYKESGDTNFRRAIQGHPLSFAVFRQAPWHHYGLLSLERTQVSLRSPFLDNAFVKAVFRAPATVLANNDVSLRLIADGDPALGALPTDRGIVYGKDSAWWRARQKAIDFTVKAEYAYDYGMPQWLAKVDRLLSPFRPERMLLGRHKFYHFRYWYRHSLSSYVQDVLLDSKTLSRSFFNRKGLEAMVKGHISGRNNWTLGIHKALSVELMHRTLIDS
ncbi:MAG TPA: asparagine synthase-related protein [Bryobacteraceae bacterium]|nr:asparagine synthase-related protein [Bryobacteraceae bacterium]